MAVCGQVGPSLFSVHTESWGTSKITMGFMFTNNSRKNLRQVSVMSDKTVFEQQN